VVTPNDGTTDGPSNEDQVTIHNDPPTAPVVDVTPDTPLRTDDLVATITTESTDPDGDPITFAYRWYKDGALQRTATTTALSDTLSSTLTADSELWRCVVTPNDGTIDGPSGEDQVRIHNDPPSAPVVDVMPDRPLTTDDLVAIITVESTDPDGDTITYTYQWYKNGVLQQTTTTSNLSDTLSSALTAKDEVWRCVVTPNDGAADGPSNEDQVTVQNSPPSAPVVAVTPDVPFTSDDLVVTITTESTDPDGDTITYTYQWYKNGVLQQTTTTSNLSDTLSSVLTARGEVWECVVTSNDGAMDGPSDERQVTIHNSPPSAPGVDVIPDVPFTSDDLVATITTESTDPDGDTITYTYQWYKDGVLQQTTTTTALSDTLPSVLTAKDEVWNCVVTPNDDTVDGASDEDQVTIQNNPPSAPEVDVAPDVALTIDDLIATITSESADPDGDAITYTYQWYRDGVLEQTTTTTALSDTLPSALTARGEVWRCVVIPNDGATDGSFFDVVTAPLQEGITAEGGSVETMDGQVTVEFPVGIVSDKAAVIIEQLPASSIPAPIGGFEIGDTYFVVEVVNNDGTTMHTLAQEVTVIVKYSDDDVAVAGGNPDDLVLAYYDEAAGKWTELDTIVNLNDRILSTTADHLSSWMVLARVSPPIHWLAIGLTGLGVILLFVGAFLLKRRFARKEDTMDRGTSEFERA
jgi:hypothetical protein